MAFVAPNFGGANLAPHVGGGRSHGGGLQNAMFILSLLRGDPSLGREVEDELTKSVEIGKIEQDLPSELQPASGPVKYKVYDDVEIPSLRSHYEEIPADVAANPESQYDAMAKPRSYSYAGKALRPQDTEAATKVQRLQAEEAEARDKAVTGGDTAKRRWLSAKGALRAAKAELESIAPYDVKVGNEVKRFRPGGQQAETIAGATEHYTQGTARVRDSGTPYEKTDFPAGKVEYTEDNKIITYPTDSKGVEWMRITDKQGNVLKMEKTGVIKHVPGTGSESPVLHFRTEPMVDPKTGEQAVDKDGVPRWVSQGYDPRTNKKSGPAQEIWGGKGATGGGIDKTEADIAKRAGEKTITKASGFQEAIKNTPVGGFVKDKKGQWHEVKLGGNGEHIAVPVNKPPSAK